MDDSERKTMNVWPDAGKRLGLGKNQTYEAVRKGEIPAVKIGGRWLVLKDAFQRMLDGRTA